MFINTKSERITYIKSVQPEMIFVKTAQCIFEAEKRKEGKLALSVDEKNF